MRGWASKAGRTGTQVAHFIGPDGKPLCSHIMFRDGPALAPFKVSWVALRDEDRHCGYCRRVLARRAAR